MMARRTLPPTEVPPDVIAKGVIPESAQKPPEAPEAGEVAATPGKVPSAPVHPSQGRAEGDGKTSPPPPDEYTISQWETILNARAGKVRKATQELKRATEHWDRAVADARALGVPEIHIQFAALHGGMELPQHPPADG